MSICWGALDVGRGYELANQAAYLDDLLRWSLDWLMKVRRVAQDFLHPSLFMLTADLRSSDIVRARVSGYPPF